MEGVGENSSRFLLFLKTGKGKTHFPAEKCRFRQKNALSCRKMPFPAEKCAFLQKNARFERGIRQETAENCRRVSGPKKQERYPTFTRLQENPLFCSLLRGVKNQEW